MARYVTSIRYEAGVILKFLDIRIAIPTWYFGAYLFGLYAGKKFDIPLSKAFFNTDQIIDENKLPKFTTVLAILVMPVLLIFMDTGLNTLSVAGVIDGKTPLVEFLRMLGQALADVLSDTGMPIIVAAFVISTCLRVAQGSATVALTTTAALIAPIVAQTTGLSELDLCFIVIAIAGGATVLSHFNDSGFWLVSRLMEMDEKTTLKTWTVMETLLGSIAFVIVAVLSFLL